MMGEKIKEVLLKRGMTQAELAREIGITEVYMSNIIKGYKIPSVPLLKIIATRLGVTVDEII